MDRSLNSRKHKRFLLVCLLSSVTGCATSPIQVPTLWDRLGIPAAGARLRDATLNRNGNFPGLEKKPPVLRIADPANLAEGKPEVVKTAAKIKQDQDMKKQKLKAIKFLAEVGCGCYNKDDQVAKALLEALNDCDPDVKKAAIAAISQNAAACNKCSRGCEVTCCTPDVVKKLEEMAVGIDEKGCPKEPDREIRSAAMSALKQCGCAPERPPEEIPALDVEEVITPDRIPVEGGSRDAIPVEGSSTSIKMPEPQGNVVTKVSFVGSDSNVGTHPPAPVNPPGAEAKLTMSSPSFGDGTEPVRLARRKSSGGEFIAGISNADQLVQARVFAIESSRNGMEVEMPDAFDLATNQQLILVDRSGNIQVATVSNSVGKRLSLKFESESVLVSAKGDVVRVGLLSQ
jgi:hypothetical protein